MEKAISCPVTLITVNEKQPRLVGGSVLIIAILFLLTNSWLLVSFLSIDFFLRAFNFGNYSPLGKFSSYIIKSAHWKGKQVDVAPKRFAAKLGFVLTLLILLIYFVFSPELSFIVTYVLIFFAILESIFGYCVGCKIYQLFIQIGVIR